MKTQGLASALPLAQVGGADAMNRRLDDAWSFDLET